jgi:hypothetical protein
MGQDERTISFAVWPHLLNLEGPAASLAAFIESLSNDSRIPRTKWSLANASGIGRVEMARRLRAHGAAVRRLGLATLTLELSDAIEARARVAKIKCFAMHMPTMESYRKVG